MKITSSEPRVDEALDELRRCGYRHIGGARPMLGALRCSSTSCRGMNCKSGKSLCLVAGHSCRHERHDLIANSTHRARFKCLGDTHALASVVCKSQSVKMSMSSAEARYEIRSPRRTIRIPDAPHCLKESLGTARRLRAPVGEAFSDPPDDRGEDITMRKERRNILECRPAPSP